MEYSEKEQKVIDSYRMFNSPEGINVIKDLEKYCNFSNITKKLNSTVDEMVFNEGKRAVFLHIKKKLLKANINIYELLK